MKISEKLKAKFSSKNKTSSAGSSPPTEPIPGHYTGRTDIEYYKPHEIPKSKYRGRVDPQHKEKLDTFSFEDAFQAVRRSSAALSGTFSPGGTKAFSRRTSYVSSGAQTPARSRRSSLSSDTNASFSVPSSESNSTHMKSIAAALSTAGVLRENSDDDTDVTNTGLSRVDTVADSRPSTQNGNPIIRLDREATVTEKNRDFSQSHIEHSRPSGDMPFRPEELTEAMTRASISPQITARRVSVFA